MVLHTKLILRILNAYVGQSFASAAHFFTRLHALHCTDLDSANFHSGFLKMSFLAISNSKIWYALDLGKVKCVFVGYIQL